MKTTTLRTLLSLLGLLLLGLVVYMNAITLWEAYGSGAPHYSRSTNMDKWSNPWPGLIVLNLLAAVVYLGWRWARRRWLPQAL